MSGAQLTGDSPHERAGDVERSITDFFREKYDRDALHLPSCRLGIHAALLALLQPGDKIIMSPVQSDSVLASVLAAGLVPVFPDIAKDTGNLSVDSVLAAIDQRLGVRAILTTNLFGCPDHLDTLVEICQEHQLHLLEDAVHAFGGSRCQGRLVGDYGLITFFSLNKYLPAAYGGAACSDSPDLLSRIQGLANGIMEYPSGKGELRRRIKVLARYHLPAAIEAWRRLRTSEEDRTRLYASRHYPPFAEIQPGLRDVSNDPIFDPYMSFQHHGYRKALSRTMGSITAKELQGAEELFARMRRAAEYLLAECPLEYVPPESTKFDIVYFRVPFFTRRRDEIRDYLRGNGITIDFYWDPPLHRYITNRALFVDATEGSKTPDAWCQDVIPLNPLLADEIVTCLKKCGF